MSFDKTLEHYDLAQGINSMNIKEVPHLANLTEIKPSRSGTQGGHSNNRGRGGVRGKFRGSFKSQPHNSHHTCQIYREFGH
ncbi:hypothetical protein Scep_010275 [Stephania cephalantha]|uniref:Uncharacterized protein n=1 Tax=Stephania cephalantha TaxID=152367 RepID=A0AAP0JVF6_9MAGN